jgi:Flp pilus assembly CpaE family ATPase
VGVTRADVEAALDTPVRFEIPNDQAVALAVNRGEPAVLSDADSPFAHAVAEIARSVRPAAAAPVTTESDSSPRWSLFDATRRRRRLQEGRA